MTDNRGPKIAAAQRRRWAELTPAQRRARTVAACYGRDLRWEREVDPDGVMTLEARAVAAARARDAHYAAILGTPA